MEEKLTTLEKYGYIYHMVGMNPITRKELREKIKKDSPKMSETTLKKYSDAPFDGAYPMFVVKDDKATLDITAFRSFIEELCKYVGTDAAVLFTGPAPAPGGRKGDNPQIAKVPNKAENPQILIERKKNTELSKQICKKQVKTYIFRQLISSTFRQSKTSTFITAYISRGLLPGFCITIFS